MLTEIPTGELLVQRIHIRKELVEEIKTSLIGGLAKDADDRARKRTELREQIADIDKELKRRDSEQRNS